MKVFPRFFLFLLLVSIGQQSNLVASVPTDSAAYESLPQSAPNISVNGNLSANKVARGRSIQATITMDIPSGYHVNSSHPLEKFLVATQLIVEVPRGLRVGSVIYPRAALRLFKFSKRRLSVYEGRAVLHFTVTAPASAPMGAAELKGKLRYQSCNNEVCFPPRTQKVSLWLTVN